MSLSQIPNPNSWPLEDVFLSKHVTSEGTKKEAKKTFELFKNKQKTHAQINLLKEKILIDLSHEDENPETRKGVEEFFEPLKDDIDANFEMGLYYIRKWESEMWAKHIKRSLDKSKKYEFEIRAYLREWLLEPIMNGYDYNEEPTNLNFMKILSKEVISILREMRKEIIDNKQKKIIEELTNLLKE
ncbi:MAG: hypothetical protein ACD_3C00081G0001 [uncultured bacterium (gcode 4)]|uniref:Uncharacterized protein n=1 Tax=uncultured bacterium (gcode 4) TaxID=1234023 RepID=K2GDH3_9BACT|nr:MAG: hypothetical protein ACD_3C00081G0001 [uncultured bacterium (gcode 4)]